MKQESFPKKESGIDRVLGTQSEKAMLEFFKNIFKSQEFIDIPEVEKSPFIKEFISKLDKYMDEFLSEYGVRKPVITEKQIHIFDMDKATPETRESVSPAQGRVVDAIYLSAQQGIIIFKPYQEDKKIDFAINLTHEMLHFSSFQSYAASDDKHIGDTVEKLSLVENSENGKREIVIAARRGGLEIVSREGARMFRNFNEALNEELNIRFVEKYFPKIDELREDVKKIFQPAQGIDAKAMESLKQAQLMFNFSYSNERKQLNDLIGDLYKRNDDIYASREDVFNVFARAALTGRLLPLARLIESTYGKGSFRELGEADE